MQQIKFEDIAHSMEADVSTARVSLAVMPVKDEVLQFRSFCLGQLLLQRMIESNALKEITQNNWGEVRRCYTASKDKVICLVQFNSSIELFPLELPINALYGHKDAITQRVRKIERELPAKLKLWKNVTSNGLTCYRSSQEVITEMNKYHKKASRLEA